MVPERLSRYHVNHLNQTNHSSDNVRETLHYLALVGVLAKRHQQAISIAPIKFWGVGGFLLFTIMSLLWSFLLSGIICVNHPNLLQVRTHAMAAKGESS